MFKKKCELCNNKIHKNNLKKYIFNIKIKDKLIKIKTKICSKCYTLFLKEM